MHHAHLEVLKVRRRVLETSDGRRTTVDNTRRRWIALYTKADGQCDKLVTIVGRLFTALMKRRGKLFQVRSSAESSAGKLVPLYFGYDRIFYRTV